MKLEGKYIRKDMIDARAYQQNIARTCLEGPTLVVLPTGLGKTVVALIVIDKILERTEEEARTGGGKVLVLAPTRPLVEQHKEFFERSLDGIPVAAFTGDLSPDQRNEVWAGSRVIVSTPQVIQNDLLTGRYGLDRVALVVFDEAHRARGNYSYVHVAELYRKHRRSAGKEALPLGMTASPGGTPEVIMDVCNNLCLVRTEVRTEEDPDVKPYVHEIETHWRVVDLPPEQKEVVKALKRTRDRLVVDLQNAGFIERSVNVSTKAILEARERIQDAIERCRQLGPSGLGADKEDEVSCLIRLSMVQAQLMTVVHALELAETQGPEPLRAFLSRLKDRSNLETWSRSTEDLLNDAAFQEVIVLADGLTSQHPKVQSVKDVLSDQFSKKADSRVIVFAHYRDTAEVLVNELLTVDGVRPCRFVGQADRGEDKGLSQRDQGEILDKFRGGTFNVLVATSVAEEGLDIPSTDMVVLFEPVASEIRAIQRRGRTGRVRTGRVELMLTRGTKDEGAYWASRAKEKRMRAEIEQLKAGIDDAVLRSRRPSRPVTARQPEGPVQGTLFPMARTEPEDDLHREEPQDLEGLSLVVDNREVPTTVAMELNRLGAKVEPRQLEVGDYILSDRVAVERKMTRDFLDSLIDGRLFEQLSALRSAYSRPLLVIEGEDMQADRNVDPRAIDGALASIVVDFGIPVLRTRDSRETASLLVRIARRERAERHDVSVRRGKVRGNLRAKLRLVIEGLPNISATLSDRLLTHFGTVHAVLDATVEQLQDVRGVGPLTAVAIHRLVRADYNDAPPSNGRRMKDMITSPEGRPQDTNEGQVDGPK
jgi:Fanconi anemia group M protein